MLKRLLIALFLGILSVAVIFPHNIFAHPLDEIGNIKVYDQVQKLVIGNSESILTVDLTFYPVEKIKVWETVDKNKDQILTDEEKDEWMHKGEEASGLVINGIIYTFKASRVSIPEYHQFFSTKPAQVQISFQLQENIEIPSELTYFYKGKDKKLEETSFEVIGEAGIAVETAEQDADSVTLHIAHGYSNSQVLGSVASTRVNQFLDAYVKPKTIPLTILLISFAVAFALGALHAMTPGHGKALVAGYLVGEKGTILNAIQLGLIITITHTASVFILGLLALLLTQYIVAGTVIYYLNKISGGLIVGLGIILLYKRGKNLMQPKTNDHDIHHHPHEHPLSHTHLSLKSLLPLGISGGIVPCADALAILVVALSLQKIALGLLLLVFFSFGLASALSLAGMIVVLAKRHAEQKVTRLAQYQKYIGLISAGVVTFLGLSLLLFT